MRHFNIVVFTALLMVSFVTDAQECNLRRIGFMTEEADYRPTQIHFNYQVQAQVDTNLTLFRLKNKAQVVMDLADKVSIDKTKRTMRVKLKQFCGWSDGTIIDAHHMLKGIQIYFEQTEFPSVFRNLFKNSKAVLDRGAKGSALGVRVIDDFTLEFDLVSSPDLLMQALSYPIFTPAPIHLMQKNPRAWPIKSIVRVSSGAYQAVIYEKMKKIEMLPNPYFCKGMPIHFDQVELIGRKKYSTFAREVVLDKVDVAFKVDPKQFADIVKSQPQHNNLTIDKYQDDNTVFLSFNVQNFGDNYQKLRQAVFLVMDYVLINRVISPGGTSHANLGISVPYPGYQQKRLTDGALPHKQRLAKAKQLMQSLGYGPDKPLNLTLLGTKGDLFHKVQLMLASKFKQIHINIEIQLKDDAEYLKSLKKGDYDLIMLAWSADFQDPSNFIEGVLSDFTLPHDLRMKFAQQLEKTYMIFDKNKRMQELAKIEHSILNLFYIIPLFRQQSYYLLRPGFESLDEPTLSARSIINKNCWK